MILHFYASLGTIARILDGQEMLVHTKEGRTLGENIHASFDIRDYTINKAVGDEHVFKVQKRT